jgi:hypothetical protein
MPTRPSSQGGRRPEVRVYPSSSLLTWLDQNTGPGRRFFNRTHAFEAGIVALMKEAGDAPP